MAEARDEEGLLMDICKEIKREGEEADNTIER